MNSVGTLIARLPRYGFAGALVVALAEALLFADVELVGRFMTPIAWTGYILLADGLVKARTGSSLLTTRRGEFAFMAVWSIVAWLVFEAYNLHLRNWVYVGLVENLPIRLFAYAWSFATIFPGILETADLLAAFGVLRTARVPAWRVDPSLLRKAFAVGAVMLIAPLLVPSAVAAYLFAPVWIGFVLVCEPITYRLRGSTLLDRLAEGDAGLICRLLAAGAICGFLWEFWNYWAIAKWHYTVPFPLDFGPKIFEMPVLGFLGFLPFAVECFCLHHLGWTIWQRRRSGELAARGRAPFADSA